MAWAKAGYLGWPKKEVPNPQRGYSRKYQVCTYCRPVPPALAFEWQWDGYNSKYGWKDEPFEVQEGWDIAAPFLSEGLGISSDGESFVPDAVLEVLEQASQWWNPLGKPPVMQP